MMWDRQRTSVTVRSRHVHHEIVPGPPDPSSVLPCSVQAERDDVGAESFWLAAETLQPLKEESGFRDVQKPFRAMEWQQGMSGVVMGLHEGAIGDDGRSPPFTSHVYGDLRSHAPTADKRPASNRNVAKSRGAPKEIGRDLVAVHEQPHRSLAVIN